MYVPDSDSIICWHGIEVPHFPPHFGYVYLIHFNEPYKHACHYLGSAVNLEARLEAHRHGNGARLMEVITDAGISWHVSKIWQCPTPSAAREMVAMKNPPGPSIPLPVHPRWDCAWCWHVLHPGVDFPKGISSTICRSHAKWLLAQAKARKEARQAATKNKCSCKE